jgi:hydroxymethylpyrimidine pyrophosphatase-like HAD family hydrolase
MYYRRELLDRKQQLTPRTAAAAAERSKEVRLIIVSGSMYTGTQ